MSIIQKKIINTNTGDSGGGGITLPIEISNVNGLQTALDSKANVIHNHAIAEIQELPNVLNSKANRIHTHAVADVTGLQGSLDAKANLTDFNNLKTYVELPKLYERSFNKTTPNTTREQITANSSVRILDRVSVVAGKKNDDYIFTSGANAFIKEINNGVLNFKMLSVRMTFFDTGAMGNTPIEIQVWRNTPTPTLVSTTSGTKITNTDTDTRVETSLVLTFSKTNTDPYVTNGYYFVLRNLSGTNFQYTQLQIDMFIGVDRAVII